MASLSKEIDTLPDGSRGEVLKLWNFNGSGYRINPVENLISNEYVFSVYVKAERECVLSLEVLGTVSEYTVGTEWTRLKHQINGVADQKVIIRPKDGTTVTLFKAMLQEGNVMTDWVRADEDLDDDLELLNGEIDDLTERMEGWEMSDGTKVYFSTTDPQNQNDMHLGDVWFNQSNGGIYVWSSSGWKVHEVGTVSIEGGCITADKILISDLCSNNAFLNALRANLVMVGNESDGNYVKIGSGTFMLQGKRGTSKVGIQAEIFADSSSFVNFIADNVGIDGSLSIEDYDVPKMLTGTVTVKHSSGGTVKEPVKFKLKDGSTKSFPSAPKVLVTARTSTPETVNATCVNVTKSGFDIYLYRKSASSSGETSVDWVAFY